MKKNAILLILIMGTVFSATCKKSASDDLTPLLALVPQCSSFFGSTTDDDDNGFIGGSLLTVKYKLCSPIQVDRISVKLSSSTNFVAGIYADSSGKPGVLIYQTGSQAGASGWNPVAFPAEDLSGGNTYWLVVISEDTGVRDRDNVGSCKYASGLWATYSGGLPADLSSQTWSDVQSEIKIYAD